MSSQFPGSGSVSQPPTVLTVLISSKGSVSVCVQVMTSANYAPHALMTYLTLGPTPILCSGFDSEPEPEPEPEPELEAAPDPEPEAEPGPDSEAEAEAEAEPEPECVWVLQV